MPTVTLSSIVEAAEKKYGDLVIPLDDTQTVTLRNALRLPKDTRRQVVKLQTELERIQAEEAEEAAADDEPTDAPADEPATGTDDDEDSSADRLVENLQQTIRLLADSARGAAALLEAIGDDIPALMELFQQYGDVAQPGEASPSET